MAMSKHTPGPWRLGEDGRFGISIWSEEHVADVKSWDRDERVANARLIAASPEMLEALKAVWPFIAKHYSPHIDAEFRLAEQINNAIRKAIQS